jgi:hypothetical protein
VAPRKQHGVSQTTLNKLTERAHCKIHGEQRLSIKLKVIRMNLFRFQQVENYQRRSPAVRDPRFDRRSNRDLAASPLAGNTLNKIIINAFSIFILL